MVLAAGLGTRLRPLTNDRPKALVEVAGRTMLQITLERLRSLGVDAVIVNTHHYADLMRSYIESRDWGMRIAISQEDVLLDTGGGLKHAGWFFEDSDEPFILHNVDVLSDIDLNRMLAFHREQNALVTLAVQSRRTSRYLLFENAELCGRKAGEEGSPELVRPAAQQEALAFAGIHVISPRLLQLIREDGCFSIINAYLRLAGEGQKIIGFRADGYRWRDLGRPESVMRATEEIRKGYFD
jgi:NDP-sugar pyrophosphorylase family protein